MTDHETILFLSMNLSFLFGCMMRMLKILLEASIDRLLCPHILFRSQSRNISHSSFCSAVFFGKVKQEPILVVPVLNSMIITVDMIFIENCSKLSNLTRYVRSAPVRALPSYAVRWMCACYLYTFFELGSVSVTQFIQVLLSLQVHLTCLFKMFPL